MLKKILLVCLVIISGSCQVDDQEEYTSIEAINNASAKKAELNVKELLFANKNVDIPSEEKVLWDYAIYNYIEKSPETTIITVPVKTESPKDLLKK